MANRFLIVGRQPPERGHRYAVDELRALRGRGLLEARGMLRLSLRDGDSDSRGRERHD
jgi:hypothetical protein